MTVKFPEVPGHGSGNKDCLPSETKQSHFLPFLVKCVIILTIDCDARLERCSVCFPQYPYLTKPSSYEGERIYCQTEGDESCTAIS